MSLYGRGWKNKELLAALPKIVAESLSKAEVLRKLDKLPVGSNYLYLNRTLTELNINTGHFTGQGHLKGKTHNFPNYRIIPDDQIFIENSTYSQSGLKRRILKRNLMKYECQVCSLGDSWQNKKLVLQLDHINGIADDNRLENLRWLCPNCHSQTDTFCRQNTTEEKGLKIRKSRNHHSIRLNRLPRPAKDLKLCKCGKSIAPKSKNCKNCRVHIHKIDWPPEYQISDLVKNLPMTTIAKFLGVSDNAIRKYCQRRKISI